MGGGGGGGGVVSRGQPLSFWERVWSSAIELPVLVPTIIGGDRNAQIYDLTALNAESAEQMALLHLTRLFPRRKEAGHARLGGGGGQGVNSKGN